MTHLFILSASTYITFRTYNTKLFMCGDFCPIPGHNTDAKYNKLAPDTQYIKQVHIPPINIFYVQYSHIFYIAQYKTDCSFLSCGSEQHSG